MAKLAVTLVRSGIGQTKRHKRTLISLGLRKLQQRVEHEDTPSLQGKLRLCGHLLKIEKIASKPAPKKAAKKEPVKTKEAPKKEATKVKKVEKKVEKKETKKVAKKTEKKVEKKETK